MFAPRREIYEFGPFRLDPVERLLFRDGQSIPLPHKLFETLLFLVESDGRLIEKEEFMRRLWPDTFVEDVTLAQNISLLRKALGENGAGAGLIQTVPKKGYRFFPAVKVIPVPPNVQPVTLDAVPPVPLTSGEAIQATVAREQPVTTESTVISTVRAETRPGWRKMRSTTGIVLIVLLAASTYFILNSRRRQALASPRPIHSLAVLPLENLSGDREQEYFADGMTDELITNLAKITQLRVISRTSVMRYKDKGTGLSLPEIARQLNVDAIIEGSISQSRGRIHLRAQLVQADPEQHLWAESYDRPLVDAVTLQNELSLQIAKEVSIKLDPAEAASLARAHPVNAEAHELYLRGRYAWNRRTIDGFQQARQYFEQAIQIDPDYAEAWAGVADTYAFLAGELLSERPTEEKARSAAQKAIALDPTLAEPHATLGLLAMNYDWDWHEAEAQYHRAIELNPNYPTAHHWYAEFLGTSGRFDEALAEINRAHQLDPLSLIINTDIGEILFLQHRYNDSVQQFRKTLEMDPDFLIARIWLALALVYTGGDEEAARIAQHELSWNRRTQIAGVFIAPVLAKTGHRADAINILNGLLRDEKKTHTNAGAIMSTYMALGDKDHAFLWMEKAYQQRSDVLPSMKVNPVFDPLRDDPRFNLTLRRLRLD